MSSENKEEIPQNVFLRVTLQTKNSDGSWSDPMYISVTVEQLQKLFAGFNFVDIAKQALPVVTGTVVASIIKNVLR